MGRIGIIDASGVGGRGLIMRLWGGKKAAGADDTAE